MIPFRSTFFMSISLLIVGAISYSLYLVFSPSEKPAPRNLILISLDTLRADRLGTYNYERPTSPFIDSWAAKSAVFENAVATAPWTLPSHLSMFTGLYPSSHGVQEAKKIGLGKETITITEILKNQGYQNYAFVAGGYVAKEYGFGRGFDVFTVNRSEHRGNAAENIDKSRGFPRTTTMAIEQLRARDPTRPFFLFLHTYAIHCPYDPPEPFASMFQTAESGAIDVHQCGRYNTDLKVTPENATYLSNRYDGGIRFVDEHLKRFFSELEKDNILKDTVIILTSDHGEEFLEHGRMGHWGLYKELLMVPLIIGGPNIAARRVSTTVSSVDLFPTILDLLSLPPSAQPEGLSLRPLLAEDQSPSGGPPQLSRPEYQLSELQRGKSSQSLIDPSAEHFILSTDPKSAELFDLTTDPREQNNLAASSPTRVETWEATLSEFVNKLRHHNNSPITAPSEQQLNQLKTLGYL